MSGKGEELTRYDSEERLPTGFNLLDDAEKKQLVKTMQEQEIQIRGEAIRRAQISKIAEHDINTGIDAVQKLDHEKKIYVKRMKGETGSGTYDLKIRGGDTKFIVPILIIIGIILVGLVLVLKLI